MFHLTNGICFERIEALENYGGVRISRLSPGEDIGPGAGETLVETDANGWASVVATMSALGETGTTFQMFLAAQKG